MPAPALSPTSIDRTTVPWWREPTREQWTSYLAAWSGWVLDGFDFTLFLLAMKDISAEFKVSYVATALSVSLTLLVRLAGGLGAGWVADRFGRKLPLMISIVWYALCDGAVFIAPTFAWVLVLRTLFGFGMGAEWTAGSALAMERWPERTRGLASGVLQGSFGLGYILAGLAYGALAPAHGWRVLFLVAAAPALLVIPIRLWVRDERPAAAPGARAGTPAAARLDRAVLRRVVWACLLYGASFAVYYGLQGMWPTLLRTERGFTPATLSGPVILFNVGMMAGAVAIGTLARRFGVVKVQVIPLLVLLALLPLYVGAVPGWLWLGALGAGMFGAGISGVTPYLFTALFPAEVRARSFGIVYHVGAFIGAYTPFLVAWLARDGRMSLSVALAGTVAVATLLTLAFLLLRPRDVLPAEVLGRSASRSQAT